jgi:hypothetical protein
VTVENFVRECDVPVVETLIHSRCARLSFVSLILTKQKHEERDSTSNIPDWIACVALSGFPRVDGIKQRNSRSK